MLAHKEAVYTVTFTDPEVSQLMDEIDAWRGEPNSMMRKLANLLSAV